MIGLGLGDGEGEGDGDGDGEGDGAWARRRDDMAVTRRGGELESMTL